MGTLQDITEISQAMYNMFNGLPKPRYRITIISQPTDYMVMDRFCWEYWGVTFCNVIEKKGCLGIPLKGSMVAWDPVKSFLHRDTD